MFNRRGFRFALCAVGLFVGNFSWAGEARIKVTSINMFLGFSSAKFIALGKYLRTLAEEEGGGPDIILLQEAFQLSEIENLQRKARYWRYAVKGDFHSGSLTRPISSGLAILSKFPLSGKKSISLPNCRGTDCIAGKGAILVKAAIPGLSGGLRLGDTHLNADYENQDNSDVRREQITKLAQFYIRELGDHPAVLGGDYNAERLDPDLLSFMNTLNLHSSQELCISRGLNVCAGAVDPTIDHQLYPPSSSNVEMTPLSYNRRKIPVVPSDYVFPFVSLPLGQMALSDHDTLEVEYVLRW